MLRDYLGDALLNLRGLGNEQIFYYRSTARLKNKFEKNVMESNFSIQGSNT